jgi:hypothetical protein
VPTAPTFGRRHMGWPSAHGVSPVVATLRLVLMSFCSLLIIVSLVTKRYEEIMVVHVFQVTKV